MVSPIVLIFIYLECLQSIVSEYVTNVLIELV